MDTRAAQMRSRRLLKQLSSPALVGYRARRKNTHTYLIEHVCLQHIGEVDARGKLLC
jgi:hypothetical protein